MTSLQLTLPMSGGMPAVLTVPRPLTADALHELEQAVTGTLGMLRRDLCDAAPAAEAAGHAARQPDAGELEYASWMPSRMLARTPSRMTAWMPDAGAIEYASWAAHLLTSRR